MRIAVFIGNASGGSLDRVLRDIDDGAKLYQKEGASLVILTGDDPDSRHIQKRCKEHSVDVIVFKPMHILDTETAFNPRLFFIRNRQMVNNADIVVIADDGKLSPDLVAVREYALRKGLSIVIV